eukprot:c21009_g1_i1 orf=142-1653(+)
MTSPPPQLLHDSHATSDLLHPPSVEKEKEMQSSFRLPFFSFTPSYSLSCRTLLCLLLPSFFLLFLLLHGFRLRQAALSPVPSPGVKLSIPSIDASFDEEGSFCPSGRIYVYDLPAKFNADLLMACSSLVRWADLCPALDNNGIGRALDMPSWLGTGFWYATSQFGGEVIYHARMLEHPCRTLEPDKASAFFVPFYAGLDVARYLFVPSTEKQRDELSHMLLEWLTSQGSWKRHGGRDHFLMVGRITWDFRRGESSMWDKLWGRSGWGSDLFLTQEMKSPVRLIIEKALFDEQEVAVPYPTSFHPRSDSELARWQAITRSVKRNLLFSYAGGPRPQFVNDFRGLLLDQCKGSPQHCRSFNCTEQRCEHPLPVMELFLDSTFCLQPRGDSFTRRSVFDSLIAGCIPVFFWHRTAYLQYGWHLPAKSDSYSVFIDRKEVRDGKRIEDILKGLSSRHIQEMRETLIAAIPRFVYKAPGNSSANFRDAFDIAIDGVLRLTRERRLKAG